MRFTPLAWLPRLIPARVRYWVVSHEVRVHKAPEEDLEDFRALDLLIRSESAAYKQLGAKE